jgi:integral membrane sensor domain MASE1
MHVPSPSLWLKRGLAGSLVCAILAAVLAAAFRHSALSAELPLFCLGAIVLVAVRFGVAAGIIGSLLATLIFALALAKQPAVESETIRANLVWMLLGGISLSYLFSTDDPDRPHSRKI